MEGQHELASPMGPANNHRQASTWSLLISALFYSGAGSSGSAQGWPSSNDSPALNLSRLASGESFHMTGEQPRATDTDTDTEFLAGQPVMQLNWANIILAFILVMLMLSTAVGNLFVIVAILIERNLRTIGNYLVLSLAIADLLVALLVMPLASIYQILERWTLGLLLCDIWTSADVFCCTASILHLLAIALDRYWAVTRVDYIRCQRNKRRILFMIFFVWITASVISLAPIFGWKDAQFEWRITIEQECLMSQDIGYQIFATCTTFYFPLTLTLIFYWKIYQVARKRIRRKPGNRIKVSFHHPSSSSSTSTPTKKQHKHHQASQKSLGPQLSNPSLTDTRCLCPCHYNQLPATLAIGHKQTQSEQPPTKHGKATNGDNQTEPSGVAPNDSCSSETIDSLNHCNPDDHAACEPVQVALPSDDFNAGLRHELARKSASCNKEDPLATPVIFRAQLHSNDQHLHKQTDLCIGLSHPDNQIAQTKPFQASLSGQHRQSLNLWRQTTNNDLNYDLASLPGQYLNESDQVQQLPSSKAAQSSANNESTRDYQPSGHPQGKRATNSGLEQQGCQQQIKQPLSGNVVTRSPDLPGQSLDRHSAKEPTDMATCLVSITARGTTSDLAGSTEASNKKEAHKLPTWNIGKLVKFSNLVQQSPLALWRRIESNISGKQSRLPGSVTTILSKNLPDNSEALQTVTLNLDTTSNENNSWPQNEELCPACKCNLDGCTLNGELIIQSIAQDQRGSAQKLQHQRSIANQQTLVEGLESKRERKAAKTLAIITGVFVMCWLPFFVMALTRPLLDLKPHKYLFAFLLWLGYVNSMLNPIIYTIFSPDFRKAFKRLLCSIDVINRRQEGQSRSVRQPTCRTDSSRSQHLAARGAKCHLVVDDEPNSSNWLQSLISRCCWTQRDQQHSHRVLQTGTSSTTPGPHNKSLVLDAKSDNYRIQPGGDHVEGACHRKDTLSVSNSRTYESGGRKQTLPNVDAQRNLMSSPVVSSPKPSGLVVNDF